MSVWRRALLLALALTAVYLANLRRVQPGGDSMPARYLPFCILGSGTLYLDPALPVAARVLPGRPYQSAYWLRHDARGHSLSTFPIVTPLLTLPLYLPAVLALDVRGWEDARLERISLDMEKLVATVVAAFGAALFYVALRRRLTPARALVLALGYALGTGTWSVASQALWTHGIAELLVIVALLTFDGGEESRGPTAGAAVLGGLACGLLVANRPPDALLAAALLAALAFRSARHAALATGMAVAGALPVLVYNLHVVGHWAGAYGQGGWMSGPALYPNGLVSGVGGLLLSPAKGLLVFSPFIALLLAMPRRSDPPRRVMDFALALACAGLLGFYSRVDWRAGDCYGARYLVDLLPALLWVLAPAVAALRGMRLWAFGATLTVAFAVQAVGAFCYPHGASDRLYYPPGLHRLRLAPSVWDWRNAAFLVEARAGLAPRLPDDAWPAGLTP